MTTVTRTYGLADDMIFSIAEEIGSDENVMKLAKNLGIKRPKARNYVAQNHQDGRVSSQGTHDLLHDWKQGTGVKKQKCVLREALKKSDLTEIADKHLGTGRKRKSSVDPPEMAKKERKDKPDDGQRKSTGGASAVLPQPGASLPGPSQTSDEKKRKKGGKSIKDVENELEIETKKLTNLQRDVVRTQKRIEDLKEVLLKKQEKEKEKQKKEKEVELKKLEKVRKEVDEKISKLKKDKANTPEAK